MTTKLKILLAIVATLIAASPVLAQVPYTVLQKLQVDGETRLLNTLDVTGAATFSGDVTVDDVLSVDKLTNTSTGALSLSPASTYYQVSPTTVLTITLGTSSAADGDLLIIHNLVATATTIVDTTATDGGSNITLNKDDIAGFIFGDGVWVELFSPNNS